MPHWGSPAEGVIAVHKIALTAVPWKLLRDDKIWYFRFHIYPPISCIVAYLENNTILRVVLFVEWSRVLPVQRVLAKDDLEAYQQKGFRMIHWMMEWTDVREREDLFSMRCLRWNTRPQRNQKGKPHTMDYPEVDHHSDLTSCGRKKTTLLLILLLWLQLIWS